MKLFTLLYILLLPLLAICQADSLSFSLTVQKDSTLNFHTENKEFFNYMESQIDNSIERGFFPRENVIVRCLLLPDSNLDSIISTSSHEYLKREVLNALNKIDKINFPQEFDVSLLEFVLIVKRWKETGDFEIRGLLIARENKNTNNLH